MWLSFDEGHRDAAALGERQLHAAAVLTDRVEAHESLVVAVMCFARAGQYARARAAATEASCRRSGSASTGGCTPPARRRWRARRRARSPSC